jgi:hypothetical protein
MWTAECGCSRTCKGSRVRHACPQYSRGHSHAGNGSPYGAGCVLEIREQPRLVDELGRLQVVEPTTERRVRELGDRLAQRERDIFADDGGDLEEAFVLLSKPVDARCQHHLDGGRERDRLGRLHQPILSALPRQHVRFHQRPAGMAPARSDGEEAAEFRDDMLAFWAATRDG